MRAFNATSRMKRVCSVFIHGFTEVVKASGKPLKAGFPDILNNQPAFCFTF